MCRSMFVVSVLVGCGNVEATKTPDARTIDAPRVVDAAVDSPPGCPRDDFDGATLGAQWAVVAGTTPTYTVSGGLVRITDAPFATTPSTANTSWVYELDTDKANQIGWSHSIGGADFTVEAEIAWASTNPELTLGAIAVADTQGVMAVMAGVRDAGAAAPGNPYVQIRAAGTDLSYMGANLENGTATFRIQRTAGTVRVLVDGTEVLSGPVTDLISNVSMVAVRHRQATTEYPFGTIDFRSVEVCR